MSLSQATLHQHHNSVIGDCGGVVGVDLQRLQNAVFCLDKTALLLQIRTQVVPDFNRPGFDAKGAAEIGLSIGQHAHFAKVIAALKIARITFLRNIHRIFEAHNGLGLAALLLKGTTQIDRSIDMVRPDLQQSSPDRLGLHQTARLLKQTAQWLMGRLEFRIDAQCRAVADNGFIAPVL